jgi:response regulator RpfG family c-di-GMP phosphodiesterase
MKAEAPSIAAEILLLSEHAEEVQLVRHALDGNNLNVVAACRDVLPYLRGAGAYSGAARPDLILLDLDVSNPDDCDTLAEIKRDPELKRIPIVVLASDDSYEGVTRAYDLHANAYILKPADPEEFVRVIRATLSFWLKLARLPRE